MEDKKTRMFFSVKNFMCLDDVTIEFKPMMLLFGKNGTGKSTLLKAIRFFFYHLFYGGPSKTIYNKNRIYYKINYNYVDDDFIDFNNITGTKKKVEFVLFVQQAYVEYFDKEAIKKSKQNDDFDFVNIKIKMILYEKGGDVHYNLFIGADNYIIDIKKIGYNPFQLENSELFSPFKPIEFGPKLKFISPEIQKLINQYGYIILYKLIVAIPRYFILNFKENNGGINLLNLPNVREQPRKFYNLIDKNFHKDDYYSIPNMLDIGVSAGGAFEKNAFEVDFYSLKRKRTKIIITSSVLYEHESLTLKRFLNKELYYLGLAKEINVIKDNNNFVGWLEITDIDGKTKYNLINSSSALIYILPILALLFKPLTTLNHYIINIEQPELHLHPKLQVKFFDTLIRILLLNYRKSSIFDLHKSIIIMETHSEYFLKKIQLLIANLMNEGVTTWNDHIAVYFFDKKEKNCKSVTIRQVEFNDKGFLTTPFPEGFFDEASELALALLEAQLNRKN